MKSRFCRKTSRGRGTGSSHFKRFLSSALPIALLGCSAMPMTPRVAVAENKSPHARSQLMYEVMIAELAGRRGYLDLATEGYLRAARSTDDVRISERATKLAVWSRQWRNAEIAARRWLELDAEAIEAHELLAQILLRDDRPEDAAIEFKVIIDAGESVSNGLRDVHSVLLREPDNARAMIAMQALQKQYPDEVEANLGVARLALIINQRDQALAAVSAALALDAKNSDALLLKAQILSLLGKPTEGFADIKNALAADENNLPLRLGYAQLLVDAGRYDEASVQLEVLFRQASDSGDANTLLTIGLLALDSKRIDAAARYLNQLLEVGEHTEQAHYYLARIADQQQEFQQAIEHYEQVPPGDLYIVAQIRAAELYAESGELQTARLRLHTLQTMLSDASLRPQVINAEASILLKAGEKAEAINVLTQGLAEFTDHSDLLYARALAADGVGDKTMLESDLSRLIEIEPDNAHALNALGYFLIDDDNRLSEAEGYLEKANRLKPNDPAIMDSLGWLRFRQGDTDAALVMLQQAYELFSDGEIAAHLGEALWKSGDRKAARTLWDKALLEAPDDANLKRVVKRFLQ